jgi:hypothetical protein
MDRAREMEFDERLFSYIDALLRTLAEGNESQWRTQMNLPKRMSEEMAATRWSNHHSHTLLLDRLDESWDGSAVDVAYLTALMHAALMINTSGLGVRSLVFLRENVFERVRSSDPEFARLETSVVGMDWTAEQLEEMIERRLNIPFHSRIALGGPTWNAFFESPAEARRLIFDYCQYRPRDVLIYCDFAIENAVSHRHERIMIEDVLAARRRFSDSRLRDLGDEYSENYPQIAVVLSRFYGLGREFTLRGIEDLLGLLIADSEVQSACASWIFTLTPEQFVRLLYGIGFVGLTVRGETRYRSSGPRDTTPPPVSAASRILIHPSYWDALDLQQRVIIQLDSSRPYERVGLVADLPEAMTPEQYRERLSELLEDLGLIEPGRADSEEYANLVGDVIKLCFPNVLTNVEPKVRNLSGVVIRDWVASNRADTGFWEIVRQRYGAVQVVWECKNTVELTAEDFQQVAYYMTEAIGRFALITHRGELTNRYIEHLRRISSEFHGVALVLGDKDLKVFLRQARNGKVKEGHLQDIYDRIVRLVS